MDEIRNEDFIYRNNGFRCPICGQEEFVQSVVKLIANYGSTEHDGETITFNVCGDCIDKLINLAFGVLEDGDYKIQYSL